MISGGWHASTENTNKVERYDVTNDKWSFVASMNERRYRPGSMSTKINLFILKWSSLVSLVWKSHVRRYRPGSMSTKTY